MITTTALRHDWIEENTQPLTADQRDIIAQYEAGTAAYGDTLDRAVISADQYRRVVIEIGEEDGLRGYIQAELDLCAAWQERLDQLHDALPAPGDAAARYLAAEQETVNQTLTAIKNAALNYLLNPVDGAC